MSQPRTDRAGRVALARNAWVRSLLDTNRGRNQLTAFRTLRSGTLTLDRTAITPLLRGKTITIGDLFPLDQRQEVITRLRTITKDAQTYRDDRAIETLHLALHLASWDPGPSKAKPCAPVVLVPIQIELLNRGADARLSRRGAPRINIALLHILENRFRCDVTALRELDESEATDAGEAAAEAVVLLQQATHNVPGFSLDPASVLGNFAFQQLQLVQELLSHPEQLMRHDVIAALAGDTGATDVLRARNNARSPKPIADPTDWQRFLIRDADSSQLQVIAAVLAGQSGVIQGPPGTGKSQVIANMIAVLAAHGKRVLFVAEKRAALDVVKNRLQATELGYMLLDFHDPKLTRKAIAAQLARAMLAVDQHRPGDGKTVETAYQHLHTRLDQHVHVLHDQREPSRLSVYDLVGRLLISPVELQTTTRWHMPELAMLTPRRIGQIEQALVEAGGFGDLFLGRHPSPWTWANLRSGEAVDAAWDIVDQLVDQHIPRLRDVTSRAATAGGFSAPQTIDQIMVLIEILPRIAATLKKYNPALFDEDLTRLAEMLAPAGSNAFQALWAFVSDPDVREAYGATRRYYHAGRFIWPWDLERDIARAAKRQEWWQAAQGESISVPSREQLFAAHTILQEAGAEEVLETLEQFVPLFRQDAIKRWLGNSDPALASLSNLTFFITRLHSDRDTPDRLPRMLALRDALSRAGVSPLLREIGAQRVPPSQWTGLLGHAWIRSCLDEAIRIEPTIRGFNGTAHADLAQRFASLDVQRIARGSLEVKAAHVTYARSVLARDRQQEAKLRREAFKQGKWRPLREIVALAPDALTAVCPCWLGSPLSVAQFTPVERQLFDVVIFDEASQIVPEVAIAALRRGAAVVVAGDRNQLPPTPFFTSGSGDEPEVPEPEDRFESLLDAASTFLPTWPLDWHYRSRDESLIGFANQEIYEGRLVTFPDAGTDEQAISHVLADSYDDELAHVVTLIAEHLTLRPKESLGVIAFGMEHAAAIERAVEQMLQDRADLERFFAEEHPERVFIRNLERVQGDERDAIILSVGYAKRADGRLALNFGPLNKTGGERRLNVAITRARRRMTVISSFTDADMAHGQSSARGVHMLRNFLAYAGRGGNFGERVHANRDLDAFEQDVLSGLQRAGLSVVPHYGMSAVPITFAIRHPTQADRFVLAIECDGPQYRDTPASRDRERLRPQQLCDRGWQYLRIWTLDWFINREAEIQRVVSAYEQACGGIATEK